MEQRFYYGIVEMDDYNNLVCVGTLDTFSEKTDAYYIPLEVYDTSIINTKMWTGNNCTNKCVNAGVKECQ